MKRPSFISFLLVGGLNTLFSYCVFALLIFLQLHYTVAVFLASALGVLFNFKSFGRLVFKSNDNSLLFRFLLVYSVVYFVNIGILKACDWSGINMYLAGFVSAIPSAGVSFLLMRQFVFCSRS